RSLQIAAAVWERHDRNSNFLDHRGKRLAEASSLAADPNYRTRLGNQDLDYLAASRGAERIARSRAKRMWTLVGLLAVATIGSLVGWWQEPRLKELKYWFTDIRGHVLTADAERALAPGSTFRECAKDCPEMIVVPPGSFAMGSPDGIGADHEH